MVVFILERVPATVRGELSRWLIEPRHGVFVGTVSGMVRDRLWEMIGEKVGGGGALLLYSSPTEQGFKARSLGDTSRSMQDQEGLLLVHIPTEQARRKVRSRTPAAHSRATVRFSPEEGEDGNDGGNGTDSGADSLGKPLNSSRPHPVRRDTRRRERPLGKTHPLYGPQGPADAWEIARYCHDSDEDRGTCDALLTDPALSAVGVRWRAAAPRNIFGE
jgi:CRISPR-associated protein Cas2